MPNFDFNIEGYCMCQECNDQQLTGACNLQAEQHLLQVPRGMSQSRSTSPNLPVVWETLWPTVWLAVLVQHWAVALRILYGMA